MLPALHNRRMPAEYIRSRIIELCSEDAYGSWELWWSLGAKKAEQWDSLCDRFIQAVQGLVSEGKVIALRKDEHNQFSVVPLDGDRLRHELQNSDDPKPFEYYWFDVANAEGRTAGTRYQYPDGRGVRVLPGNPSDIDLVKRCGYSRIIHIDNVSDPIPLVPLFPSLSNRDRAGSRARRAHPDPASSA